MTSPSGGFHTHPPRLIVQPRCNSSANDATAFSRRPSHGTALVNGVSSITYTPTTNYSGADTITYSATNLGGSSSANLSITVSAPAALGVTIGGGASGSGHSASHIFSGNSATVTGGSGSFTYLWSNTNDGFGTWTTGGTASSFAPSVSGVAGSCTISSATYTVTVTDTVTHQTKTSSGALYTWTNSSGIC